MLILAPKEISAKASLSSIRHPERSEAKGFASPSGWTRAQSKDLVALTGDDRNGFESLHAKPVRRSVATTACRTTDVRVRATWVLRLRLGDILGQRDLPLAFAQDDGAFLRDGTFAGIAESAT